MLRQHLEFRKLHRLDEPRGGSSCGPGPVAVEFPEVQAMKQFYPHCFHKTDRRGRPIYIERLGKLDCSGLLSIVTEERLLEYFAYESERQTTLRLPACSLAVGQLLESTISILDLHGLGFSHVTNTTALRIVRSITREQEANFPEVTGAMFIVNAPAVFSIAWSLVKPWLSATTLSKVHVFAAGQVEFKERLLEFVAPENLPTFLGGVCTCPGKAGGCMGCDDGPWSDPAILHMLEKTPYWEVLRHFAEERGHGGVAGNDGPLCTAADVAGPPCAAGSPADSPARMGVQPDCSGPSGAPAAHATEESVSGEEHGAEGCQRAVVALAVGGSTITHGSGEASSRVLAVEARAPAASEWALGLSCLAAIDDGSGVVPVGGGSQAVPPAASHGCSSNGREDLGVEPQLVGPEEAGTGTAPGKAAREQLEQWLRESAQALGPWVSCGGRRRPEQAPAACGGPPSPCRH